MTRLSREESAGQAALLAAASPRTRLELSVVPDYQTVSLSSFVGREQGVADVRRLLSMARRATLVVGAGENGLIHNAEREIGLSGRPSKDRAPPNDSPPPGSPSSCSAF